MVDVITCRLQNRGDINSGKTNTWTFAFESTKPDTTKSLPFTEIKLSCDLLSHRPGCTQVPLNRNRKLVTKNCLLAFDIELSINQIQSTIGNTIFTSNISI